MPMKWLFWLSWVTANFKPTINKNLPNKLDLRHHDVLLDRHVRVHVNSTPNVGVLQTRAAGT